MGGQAGSGHSAAAWEVGGWSSIGRSSTKLLLQRLIFSHFPLLRDGFGLHGHNMVCKAAVAQLIRPFGVLCELRIWPFPPSSPAGGTAAGVGGWVAAAGWWAAGWLGGWVARDSPPLGTELRRGQTSSHERKAKRPARCALNVRAFVRRRRRLWRRCHPALEPPRSCIRARCGHDDPFTAHSLCQARVLIRVSSACSEPSPAAASRSKGLRHALLRRLCWHESSLNISARS